MRFFALFDAKFFRARLWQFHDSFMFLSFLVALVAKPDKRTSHIHTLIRSGM